MKKMVIAFLWVFEGTHIWGNVRTSPTLWKEPCSQIIVEENIYQAFLFKSKIIVVIQVYPPLCQI